MTREDLNQQCPAFVVAEERMWSLIASRYPNADFRFARNMHEACRQVDSVRNIRKKAGESYRGTETIIYFRDKDSLPLEDEEFLSRLGLIEDIELLSWEFVSPKYVPDEDAKHLN